LGVGGAAEKLAVISLFGFDTGLVQTEFACLGLADVTAKGGMAAKRTRRPGVGLSLELVERLETPVDLGDDVHALLLVPFGLSRVVDNDITPGSRALLADDHLFDLKTLFELLVGAGTLERLVDLALRAETQLLTDDVVIADALEDAAVFLRVEARVHDRDDATELPAVEVLFHLLHEVLIGGIARPHPAAHRDPAAGDREAD